MSWLRGYSKTSTSAAESREEKRKRLEEDRQSRAKNRAELQKQLAAAQQSRQEADQALRDLFDIDPSVFEEQLPEISISEDILDEDLDNVAVMTDFDTENGTDGKSALSELKSVQCPFMKDDIVFWFGQLEGQLEVIEVKSQWMKRIALQRFLPAEIQSEVKSLLSLARTAAGDDIYLKIKTELIELFGQKPEDAYTRAANRVLTGKPSQLGKALIDDLCQNKKLDGCCCEVAIWGMFREKLPIVVRNHIAEEKFNKDTYKRIFKKADQVWDSNQASEPLPGRQVAAVVSASGSSPEVAAVQRNGQFKNKNKNQNQGQNKPNNGQGQSQSQSQSKNKNSGQNEGQKEKKLINENGHCRIHAKWKENANFCAAPWGCKMKNVYKSPQ